MEQEQQETSFNDLSPLTLLEPTILRYIMSDN